MSIEANVVETFAFDMAQLIMHYWVLTYSSKSGSPYDMQLTFQFHFN